jgi:hypothetical protein
LGNRHSFFAAGYERVAFRAGGHKPAPDRLFDQYGLIGWNDEKARLDNFAIQIIHDPDYIGYIFVYDGKDICAGEAQARALRVKENVVDYRGVPWKRVIWRYEGYAGHFSTVLQPVSRGVQLRYPFMGPFQEMPKEHLTKHCGSRIARIKNSKW